MTADREADALSSHLIEIAIGAAHAAGAYFTPFAGRIEVAAEKKGFFDPVTECDRESERRIVERIFRDHPDSTIVGEEGGQQGSGAVHWYVDPIDGTNNFVAGIPFFCVSIAAAVNGRLLAGVVYDPSKQETFAASTAGATLNGEPIRCTGSALDSGATLLTEYPRSGRRATPEDMTRFGEVLGSFRAVRRLGSTALHLAYVAAGRADATFGMGTNPWDIAAGVLLVQQAGGRFLVPPGNAAAAEQPWLTPDYFALTPELDLERSVLGAVVWRDLFGAREAAPAR
ncbi:MAG TPA: inositol monophosphatase family protein [Chloroflexota bacterium]|nr:inositol monophosphatase family protein [Chloroflexota bacterium]